MNTFLVAGIILLVGFALGQELQRLKMPKIIGYLLAGVFLNPHICKFVPKDITTKTDMIENIAISFIAFAIGGTMIYSEIKKLGKGIIYITLFEAQVAFFAITAGFLVTLPFVIHSPQSSWLVTFVPISLLLGCLGCPTDPSVALAVTHQYNTKGEVTSTILSVAAFDDVLGIINYSVAIVLAKAIALHQSFNISNTVLTPAYIIAGSIALGIVLGFIFNIITKRIIKESEGVLFVVVLSFLTLCWGLATFLRVEQILSIMIMGIAVANVNPYREKIFKMLERYSEELVFLIFFVLSGMHLDFSGTAIAVILLLFFIIYRIIGKYLGTFMGAAIAHSSDKVKKYTASGLIPYGGIVIGLALLMQQQPAFSKFGGYIVNTIIAATIINELIGPIFVKKALRDAGELKT